MIFDSLGLFSNKQAVTASAASTNTIDLGPPARMPGATTGFARDIGPGTPIPLLVQVTEQFAGLTSLKISLQCSDEADFATADKVTEVASTTMPVASLKAGARWNVSTFPSGTKGRYVRLYYTVTGTATAGAITAGVTAGNDETSPY